MANKKKIVILGLGLAGSIMQAVLSTWEKEILNEICIIGDSKYWDHKALFRFQNADLGALLGIDLIEIIVYKAIYYRGKVYTESNILFSNLYSLKTVEALIIKSIKDLTPRMRWLPKTRGHFRESRINRGWIKVLPGRVSQVGLGWVSYEAEDCKGKGEIDCDTIISTLPMEFVVNCLGLDLDERIKFKSSPIFIYRADFEPEFNELCQTIYFPDLEFPVYRASIDFKEIIIEAIRECKEEELLEVLGAFGLSKIHLPGKGTFDCFIQKYGKIKPLQDEVRQTLLYKLTTDYNIYSLGRFALWKNLKADEILQDAQKIKKYIESPVLSQKYFSRRGGV